MALRLKTKSAIKTNAGNLNELYIYWVVGHGSMYSENEYHEPSGNAKKDAKNKNIGTIKATHTMLPVAIVPYRNKAEYEAKAVPLVISDNEGNVISKVNIILSEDEHYPSKNFIEKNIKKQLEELFGKSTVSII